MGAGKSTVGRQLASRLSFTFLDTDHVIEERTGADIPWIFDVEGEDGFRQRESAVLQGLVEVSNHVVATGGGIIERECNHKVLRSLGFVVYLTASIEQLYSRTSKDKKRPLLQVEDPRRRIVELIERRDPIYRSVCHHVMDTDGRNSHWVVQQIAALFQNFVPPST